MTHIGARIDGSRVLVEIFEEKESLISFNYSNGFVSCECSRFGKKLMGLYSKSWWKIGLFCLFLMEVNCLDVDEYVPPNIYRWIASNRRICTFRDFIIFKIAPKSLKSLGIVKIISILGSYESINGFFGFLDEKRGLQCSACPKTSPHGIPRMACAEIVEEKRLHLKTVCYESSLFYAKISFLD